MNWFIADFDGKNGIRRIIKEMLQKDVSDYGIRFKPYNWDSALHNFESE